MSWKGKTFSSGLGLNVTIRIYDTSQAFGAPAPVLTGTNPFSIQFHDGKWFSYQIEAAFGDLFNIVLLDGQRFLIKPLSDFSCEEDEDGVLMHSQTWMVVDVPIALRSDERPPTMTR